eukprot:1981855-Prorocentrum_lima.AAC.1
MCWLPGMQRYCDTCGSLRGHYHGKLLSAQAMPGSDRLPMLKQAPKQPGWCNVLWATRRMQ